MLRPGAVRAVAVVVPAHDEEALLPACLASVRLALAGVPALDRVALVVLDDCTDGSAAQVAAAGVVPVVVRARNVGVARAAGMRVALSRLAGHRPEEVWLATTDADSVVRPDWLASQVAAAARGSDAVIGTVDVVDWTGHPPTLPARYWQGYGPHRDDHPHVHGANLGVRASAYLAVGGFPAAAAHEDVLLVDALTAGGYRVTRSGAVPVVTSARPVGRAAAGFADHLRSLTA